MARGTIGARKDRPVRCRDGLHRGKRCIHRPLRHVFCVTLQQKYCEFFNVKSVMSSQLCGPEKRKPRLKTFSGATTPRIFSRGPKVQGQYGSMGGYDIEGTRRYRCFPKDSMAKQQARNRSLTTQNWSITMNPRQTIQFCVTITLRNARNLHI